MGTEEMEEEKKMCHPYWFPNATVTIYNLVT